MSLPSLRNLQVFEAAARHQSFRAAADSLFLTHGAVSRQVRALEGELGVTLFTRIGRGVALTPEGHRLQLAMTAALRLIATTTTALRQEVQQTGGRLQVTVLPSFATRWLAPRLADFHARNPGIKVDLIATLAPLDLVAKQIPLGIRNGSGNWNGLVAQRLARETLFPVVAASGVLGLSTLPRSAHDMLRFPLLNPYDEWEQWFRRAGVIGHIPDNGPTYEDAMLLLQAAEQGKGIALGRNWLVSDAIKAGTLVRVPGPAIARRRDYYLVYPEGQPLSATAQVFTKWLFEEMDGS